MYHFTDGGLRNVWLENGYEVKDSPYGKAVAFHDLDSLIKAICMALVKKQGKLSGAEFRYLRNDLLLSQKSLGKLLGCTEQAVAKWEKSGKIPKTAEFVVRIIYLEKNNGHEEISATLEMLNVLDRIASGTRIVVTERGDKWISKCEADQVAAM